MGRKTLQIASTAGINANDVIEIYTPGNNGGFIDTSVIVNNGESCLVSYVIDGASLYLSDGVMDEGGYDPANGAVIRKWNTINDITIASDVKIKAKGRPQGSGYGDVGIVVFFGRNVNIHCSTYQVDQQSLRLESCYDCEASQMHIVVDPQNTNQNINYGIVYSGSSKHIRIHHNSCANMRHGIVSSHLSSLYGFYGVSRLIDIHHNQIWNTWHAGIATHNDTDRVTINNNLIQGCAFGVNLRERNAEIRSNRIAMCGQGVYLSAHPRNIRIVENVFEDSFGGAVTTSFDGVGDISDIVIEGNEVVRGVSGIQVTVLTQVGNGNRRFRIKNNVIESLSGSGGNDAAIRFTGVAYDVHIENNTITDIQNAGGIRTDNGGSRFIIKGNTVTGIATNAAISTVGTSYANSYGVGNIYQGNWTGASNLSNYSTFFNDNDNF